MTSARTHMCAIRSVICSPASSDVMTNMPHCDAAFDVPLYAAAAALTPCSRPTLSTKHDFACCTSSNEIRLATHFAIFAVSLDACFCTYMQLCNYASEPLLPVWCSTGSLYLRGACQSLQLMLPMKFLPVTSPQKEIYILRFSRPTAT